MIAALNRRLRRVLSPEDSEKGISLSELLVALTVFGFLLAMTLGFFVSASRANVVDRQIDSTNRIASTGMNEMAQVIRGSIANPVLNQTLPSPAFVTIGSNSITVYTAINASAQTSKILKVGFAVVGTNLMEYTWLPTVVNGLSTFATAPSSTRILAAQVLPPASGGATLFSYVDSTGATIPLVSNTIPAASVAGIAAVQVSLQIGTANTGSQSTLLTNTVGLPNLSIARNPS